MAYGYGETNNNPVRYGGHTHPQSREGKVTMDRDMFEARIQMLQAEVQIYRDGMVDATRRINELRELEREAGIDPLETPSAAQDRE